MPFLVYGIAGVAGYIVFDRMLDAIENNLVTLAVIGGVSYYVFKKVI